MLIGVLCVAGCGTGTEPGDTPAPSTSTVRDSTTAASSPPAAAPETNTAPTPFTAAFAELEPRLPGTVGIGAAPVGGNAASAAAVTQAGVWTNGVAWSTIKVPLSLAAMRTSGQAADSLSTAAITQSDNAAAEGLWSLLGDPITAARAVGDVLGEAGDSTTRVQSQRVRPPFTAFGQTMWSISDQTLFTAQLPCLPGADAVTELMGELVPSQQWGLARIPGAKSKAGWGPGEAGGYLVRQLAVITTPEGQSAVTVAAEPASGTFEDGIAILNSVATWVEAHLDLLPSGTCL